MQTHHFLSKISKPTLFPNSIDNSSTFIEHIWFNSNIGVQVGIIAVDITDHCPIFMHYPYNNHLIWMKLQLKLYSKTAIKLITIIFLIQSIDFDWNSIAHSDVSDHVDAFLGTVINIFCNSFPLLTKFIWKIEGLSNLWMNGYLSNLIKMESRYLKLF